MSGWIERRGPRLCLLIVAVFTVGVGCADDSAEANGLDDPGDMSIGRPDVTPLGPDANPDCILRVDRACYDDPEVRCAAVAQWVSAGRCTDDDRDCFVGACRDGLDAEAAVLADCDDRDPDVHPAAAETCTEVDHDCDGESQEGFELGGDCDACGAGKVECAIDDPYSIACSTAAGQSAAPDPLPAEQCDGVDQDCDGAVDEGCRLPAAPDALLETPALCPDGAVAVIEDGALMLIGPVAGGPPPRTELRPAAARATLPACGPAGLAWLERMDDAPCVAPRAEPLACPSTVWFLAPGGQPLQVTDLPGAFGRPAVGLDGVWWHSVLADQPGLLTWAVDDDRPRAALAGAYSDPTAPDDGGWLAVRAWDDGPARVIQLDVQNGSQRTANGAPGGQRDPGPPTRDGRWMAWSGGGDPPVLWVVADEGDDGFRPVAGPGPQVAPRLAGQVIVWLDGAAGALRTFDLRTGDERTLTDGPVDVDAFAVRRGEAVWVEPDPAGDRLIRAALPDAPPPEPLPDLGLPDMGPPDMGPPDMGPPEGDAGPDQDPDMGPPAEDLGLPDMGSDTGLPDMAPMESDFGVPEADAAVDAPDLGVDAPDMAP